ncbi:recombinase family protein [Micropruina sp.]|uniref:recombinase family protein n=1 Tax=Micropruina sp. TaxID=2737536 RepID=UPI0039E3356C
MSTTDQARRGTDPDGLSIPAQREANRRRALEMGALIVAEFIERGCSGRSLERPELQRMLRYIQDTPVDFVIVHKIDRLARNRADDAAITKTILETGAHLVSTTEAISTSPSGRLLHGIMASIAEFYSQNLATEVTKGMRQKATQGGTPGRAPLGYLNQRHIEDGHEIRTVTVDPERGPHLAWAFRAYATGEWSMDEIASELNARGLTTRPGPNTSARPLTIRSVHHLLRNPYYAGIVTFNGVEYPGTHEPLVDAATWASVQDILVARRNGERSRTHDHYLKGTVYCLACGYRLILQHTRRRERQYEYFLCHRGKAGCPQRKALPVAQVEQRIADCYRNVALTVAQRERIEGVALARLRRQHETSTARIDDLNREIARLEANRAKLLDAYYADAVPRSLFLAEQRRLKAEHARIVLERTTAATDLADLEDGIREALNLLQDAHATYERSPAHIRKQLNRTLFARILLGPDADDIRVELNEPYTTLSAGNPDEDDATEHQNLAQQVAARGSDKDI